MFYALQDVSLRRALTLLVGIGLWLGVVGFRKPLVVEHSAAPQRLGALNEPHQRGGWMTVPDRRAEGDPIGPVEVIEISVSIPPAAVVALVS